MIVLSSYKYVKKMRVWERDVEIYSISNSEMKGVKLNGKLEFLVPDWKMVKGYKWEGMSEEEFIEEYRKLMVKRWKVVKKWLMELEKEKEVWLLCWEGESEFCHRLLVGKMIKKWRRDIVVLEL